MDKYCKEIASYLKLIDAFAKPVQLNFDSKGPKHRTFCGVFFTLGFLVLAWYIIDLNY